MIDPSSSTIILVVNYVIAVFFLFFFLFPFSKGKEGEKETLISSRILEREIQLGDE